MPVPTANISGDINAAIGEVSTIRVTAVYSDPVWADETNNTVIAGGGVIPVTADGLIDVNLPQTNDTVRLAIRLEYVDNATRRRESKMSDWQELTGDVDFATFMAMSPTSVPLSTAEALAARIDGYQDHGDVSGVLTIDPATGTHVVNATGSLLVTLDTAPNGRIVTLYVVGGATNVTVDGIADLELTDGAFASFVRIRGVWVLASAGASGTPATPDTTPPTAVTDLAVTPGDDGVTATATFSPTTDAESTVKYRYRLYATGTTAPAWPTSGSQYNLTGSPINLTGLTAGEDYTMDLQAYSAGGSATADTATFTTPTPAGWSTVITDDFTATDNSPLGGRTTTTGSATWSTGLPLPDALHIVGGKVNMPAAFGYQSGKHSVPVPAGTRAGIRVSADYTLAAQTNTLLGGMSLQIDGGPTVLVLKATKNDAANTANWFIQQGNGMGQITMSTTTALPLTGRLSLQVVGATVTVLLNGTEYSTGTAYTADFPTSNLAAIELADGRTSYLDNFQVEVLT